MRMAADVLEDIAYAAFQTHYKATMQPGWKQPHEHWNANPGAQTLWRGLIVGVIVNVTKAQEDGKVRFAPDKPGSETLPLLDPVPREVLDTAPAALARRLAAQLPGRGLRPAGPLTPAQFRDGPLPRPDAPHTHLPTLPALAPPKDPVEELQPGLAIGRCTECDD